MLSITPRKMACRVYLQKTQGFSLIELITTMAIAGIFMAIAIPSYQSIISSTGISAEVNDLYRDLEFARSEATKRGLNVAVCPSSNGSSCSTQASWASGWIVMVPSAGSCVNTTGTVLRIKQTFTSKDTAAYTPSQAGQTSLCFNRMGFVPTSNLGMFTFNTTPANNSTKRCLAVSAVGHVQILQQGQTDVAGAQCT